MYKCRIGYLKIQRASYHPEVVPCSRAKMPVLWPLSASAWRCNHPLEESSLLTKHQALFRERLLSAEAMKET